MMNALVEEGICRLSEKNSATVILLICTHCNGQNLLEQDVQPIGYHPYPIIVRVESESRVLLLLLVLSLDQTQRIPTKCLDGTPSCVVN